MILIQDLDETVIGKTIRVEGRRPMKVLSITHNPCPLKRVVLRVVVDQIYERVIGVRKDTVVFEVDVSS